MTRLQRAQTWRREAFVNPPTPTTVRRWCESGDIPSKKIGGTWYVVVDELGQLDQSRATGNSLADQLLTDWSTNPT